MDATVLLAVLALGVVIAVAAAALGARIADDRGRRPRSGPTAATDAERARLDAQLGAVHDELARVTELVHTLERDRRSAFGELTNELRHQHESVAALTVTTRSLREALSSTTARGQWGERMAEDVLRLAGFLEGVSYRRHRQLDGDAEGSGGIPDFTFLMPNDLVLHMDVKFPLDNYARYLECTTDQERARARDRFLRDVRERVRELHTRGYLDAGDRTVDCLLLFIPNEQVYAFVQEHAPDICDDALRHKIVLCSPLTLFAVLAVIRQAVDNFRLERTSSEILTLLRQFEVQWEKYTEALDKVQRRFDAVARDYAALMTTRTTMLRRPLDRIDALARPDAAAGAPGDTPALDS